MALKSTQTNKYETACYIQEASTACQMDARGFKVHKSAEGLPYCEFDTTLQTYGCYNRMNRMYDAQNVDSVITNDERINDLKAKRKWRGEWNHPNPDIKGQTYSDIRMTIPEPIRTSHFILENKLVGNNMEGRIMTHPRTECGRSVASEIMDIGSVPAFSVRLLGNMIPNAPRNQPNVRVTKVITFDMVDYESHAGSCAKIKPKTFQEQANVVFLKELAKHCCEQEENARVICESFEISLDDIVGITANGSIDILQEGASRILIPTSGNVRREALSFLTGMNGGR